MIPISSILAAIPDGLREPLLDAYQEIVQNYTERRWEPAELNGGKLCEVVFTIIEGALAGAYAATPCKPPNIVDACRQIERLPANAGRVGDRSLRIQLPRAILYLYEIRNNRGVGHAGGDVNPNYADATVVVIVCGWMVAELIRIYHGVSLEEAQATVDALVERKLPLIWDAGTAKRVLQPGMSMREQTLSLLYSESDWVEDRKLQEWVEYSTLALYRQNILRPMHRERLLEYNDDTRLAKISPLGVRYVEENILSSQTS